MRDNIHRHQTSWLWAAALVILLIGGTITWLLATQGYNVRAQKAMILFLASTIIGVGICVISATSHWWLHK